MAQALDLRDFGATLDGSGVGDSAAFAAAVDQINNNPNMTNNIRFNGVLTLTSPPPPLSRIHLWGDDIYGSLVLKKYPGGVLFYFNNWSGGGLHNFSVPQDTGTPGSYTILVRANSVHSPSGIQLENLYLGSGIGPGPWRTIEIDGGAHPLGIRQARLHNVSCFGSSGWGNVVFIKTVDTYVSCLRVYPAGGTYDNVFWGDGNSGQVII